MPRVCTVCASDQLNAINIDIVSNMSYKAVGEKYGLTPSAVFRHAKSHVGPAPVKAVMLRANAKELVDQGLLTDEMLIGQLLAGVFATAQEILDKAMLSEKLELQLKALKEARDSLMLLYKFTAKQTETVVDTSLEDDFKALVLALRRTLPDHRDAARDIVNDLNLQGAMHLASTIERVLVLESSTVQ